MHYGRAGPGHLRCTPAAPAPAAAGAGACTCGAPFRQEDTCGDTPLAGAPTLARVHRRHIT
ncbi:hypothetical protein TPA0905_75420 [Streptomyces olivaceus]|nr:hypothetical protein TPA0905_75420 [Streptomyces olivaceus]